MLPMRRQPLAEWLPDQPDYGNPGALEARNVIPQAMGYRDFRAPEVTSPSAGEEILNAVWSIAAGTVVIIAGTPTRLLQLDGASWSAVGSSYPNVTSWEFARFGALVVAVAPGVAPQVIDLSAVTPSFSDLIALPENPPQARRIGVVNDFVVVGDLDSDSRLIQWSGNNNAEIWDAFGSVTYQADSQLLQTGGQVQKIIGGPFGYVFQEREIKTLEYVGPPVVFSIQPITRERGALSGDAVAAAGDRVFFLAQDGFYMLQGTSFQPIGNERVNRWFFDNVGSNELENVKATVDRQKQIAVWTFSTIDGGTPDRALLYNYAINRWSYVDLSGDDIARILELRTVGYTLDTLDTILTSGIDIDSFNLDGGAYAGGSLTLFGVTTSGELASFTGTPKEAVIDTTEVDGGQNRRMSVANIRPLVEGVGTTVEVQLGRRDLLTEVPAFTAPQSLNVVGEAPILSDSRYTRARLRITGGFEHASAVDFFGRPSGRF